MAADGPRDAVGLRPSCALGIEAIQTGSNANRILADAADENSPLPAHCEGQVENESTMTNRSLDLRDAAAADVRIKRQKKVGDCIGL